MRLHVDVWSRSGFENEAQKVTDSDFVFVALEELWQPRELPEKKQRRAKVATVGCNEKTN